MFSFKIFMITTQSGVICSHKWKHVLDKMEIILAFHQHLTVIYFAKRPYMRFQYQPKCPVLSNTFPVLSDIEHNFLHNKYFMLVT